MDNKPTILPKGRYRLQYRGTECTNCSHPLDISDKYCPNCSQANSTKKLNLKDFFDEFFASMFSYDSRLLKTLSALLLSPGKITRDYIKGKRVSYTNPFRFLLSLAIIYFLILNLGGKFDSFDKFGQKDLSEDGALALDLSNLSDSAVENDEELKKNMSQLDSLGFKFYFKERALKNDSLVMHNPKMFYDSIAQLKDDGKRFSNRLRLFQILQRKDDIYTIADVSEKYNIPVNFWNKVAFNLTKSILSIAQRPGSYFSNSVSKLPFVVFFFLPIFALFIWLVFIRKKYNYTDHLIFSFHNQSLLFILLIISILIDSIFKVNSSGIFLFIFLIYLYKAMRNFYKQGRFKTIVKYLLLNTIFFILASITIIVFFAGSLFTL